MPQPRLTLKRVSVWRKDQRILRNLNWRINAGENWAVLGANGSGKSTLAAAIAGEALSTGEMEYSFGADGDPCEKIASVSFHLHRLFVAQSDGYYQSRWYIGEEESTLTARQVLQGITGQGRGAGARINAVARKMRITRMLDRQTLHLSTGEMRRLLIARALCMQPELLILDEPFIGLDVAGRAILKSMLERLMHEGQQVIFMRARPWELPDGLTHSLWLKNGKIVNATRRTGQDAKDAERKAFSTIRAGSVPVMEKSNGRSLKPVIELQDVNLDAGRAPILKNMEWTVLGGERWSVSGPNGSGKTTLLSLLSGDHPQCHVQSVRLFGLLRDEGPTIWELKAKIGWASPDIALHYDAMTTTFDFICTGFFETLGLYRRASPAQQRVARGWVRYIGLTRQAEQPFRLLSDGQQRLAILARAFVKRRRILILDEPCQGLDISSRDRVLKAIDAICLKQGTSLVIVTHYAEELPRCMTHRLELRRGAAPRFQAMV